MTLSHKEMTAHIRKRIKVAGINAKIRMASGNEIVISAPTYDYDFSEDEQRAIRHIAQCNNLTLVRGMRVNVEQMTNPHGFNFFMPVPSV